MSKRFEKLTEIIGWIQIMLSPTLFCVLIGAFIYFSNPTTTRLVIALVIALFGLIVGILYATHIWKTKGTIWFVSRVSATPELDEEIKKEKEI